MNEPSRRAEMRWLAALFLAAAVLYSIGMTRAGFEGKDERRYSQVAKELSGGAGLVVLRYLGGLYPDKPPLFFWIEGLSFRLFGGVSPAAARLPLFLSALAALAFAYLMMRQIDGPRAALVGTAALALSFRFLWAGRWVKLDMPMCAFTFAAFWASARILFPKARQNAARLGWALAAWAFAALAVLSKGPGGAVWLGAILTHALLRRDGSALRRHHFVGGIALLAAMVGAWLIPTMLLGGPQYWRPMLGTHVVARFAGLVRHEQPLYYFIPKLLSDGLPMAFFLPAALWWSWRERRQPGAEGRVAFPWAWIGFTLLFFSIPSGKRPQYILPLYPAAALLVARFLLAGLSANQPLASLVLRWHVAVCACAILGGGAVSLFLRHAISLEYHAVPPPLMRVGLFVALGGGGAVGVWALWRRRTALAIGASAAAVYLAYLLLFGVYLPLNRDDSAPRGVAELVAREGGAGEQIGLYGIDDRFTLYGEGLPRILTGREQAESFMAAGPKRWLAVTNVKYDALVERRGRPPWRELARWKDRVEDQPVEIILFASN